MEQEDPTDAPWYSGRRHNFLQMQRLSLVYKTADFNAENVV
jgi:hypothetical protein